MEKKERERCGSDRENGKEEKKRKKGCRRERGTTERRMRRGREKGCCSEGMDKGKRSKRDRKDAEEKTEE